MITRKLAFGLSFVLLAFSTGVTSSPGEAQAQVVETIGARTVRHIKGKIGGQGGYMTEHRIPARDEYYLEYTILFRPGFDWTEKGRPRGGKFPGLAGGTATGGCRAVDRAGWSARQTWGADGTASLYLYHQSRSNRCGDKFYYRQGNGQLFKFATGRRYRITQRVKVNTPNALNGEVQIWVDGQQVLFQRGLRLRGSVSTSSAQIDKLKYHSYFGGDNLKFAPANDSYTEYGTMYVMTCKPNFMKAVGNC